MTYFFLFLFGLGIGSFLNVVSLRYREGGRLLDLGIIGGRSRCRMCHAQLRWYELIPLFSFLALCGRCRTCGAKLLWQYPIVELLSGLIFVFVSCALQNFEFRISNFELIFQSFNPLIFQYLLIASWILVFELFLLLSVIDFRLYIIPNQINGLLLLLGFVITFLESRLGLFGEFYGSFIGHYAAIFGLRENIFINHTFAALVGFVSFYLIVLVTRGRGMGWGDVKLIAPIGLLFGWPDIVLIVGLSFIVGAICVTPLLLRRAKHMKDEVPFGPFIIIAATLVFFFGYEIMKGYFSLFRI